MPDLLTIPKTSSFPLYLDFSQLRAAGIRHIESLGSDLWTDYNVHDPGITILEVICFALTDLGYRTNFDIKDLLSRSREVKEAEPQTIFKLPFDDNFFTAAEVLSCNPVTINDFRKLLVDIPGVKNAWLKKAPDGEHAIYLNRKCNCLTLSLPEAGDEQNDRVLLRGLYDVYVELDEILRTDACGRVFFSENDILDKVYAVLNQHRNLCEDIREVVVLDDEQIAVCADIELLPNADPEDVLLEIYKRVEEFLSPTLRFYTLQEMLARKIPVEEIFAGRPLTAESHGFVDLEELNRIELREEIHVSDIYQVIMDIPGIAAVRDLSLTNYIDGIAFTKGEKWCLPLKPLYRAHFDLEKSKITFFKDVLPFSAGVNEVRQRYNEEKAAKKKALLDPYQLDLPVPEGTYRDIDAYTSIMEEFPLTYGVGAAGIKQPLTPVREGQSRQLKSYLLFFDQLLANYLNQLSHLRDLFSVRSDDLPQRKNKNHTYFTHILKEVPGIEDLVKNVYDCSANDTDVPPPEDYPSYLQYIAESLETYRERRGRFLDHLLARFAESFTDYALLSYKLDAAKPDPDRILQDKADFLKHYPDISRNRGKGMDYTAEPVWDTENISGLEKRVSKLIGIDNPARRTLGFTKLSESAAGWSAELLIGTETVMTGKTVWPTEDAACAAIMAAAKLESNYRRYTVDVVDKFVYKIQIVAERTDPDTDEKTTAVLATSHGAWPSEGRYCEAVDHYIETANTYSGDGPNKQEVNGSTVWTFNIVARNGKGEITDYIMHSGSYPDSALGKQTAQDDLAQTLLYLNDGAHYCQLQLEAAWNHEYGFYLQDSTGSVMAESAKRYFSAEDRDNALFELLDRIYLPLFTCEPVREKNCFYLELYDYTGEKLLLVSQDGFASKSDASNFFDAPLTVEDLKGWAVQSGHHEKTGTSEPYSFLLKNRDNTDAAGMVKAVHPHQYATEQERDDRLQAIIYYLDDVPPTLKVEHEKVGDFLFDITDSAGTVLLKSARHYTTQIEAENAAWKTRLQARHRVYYKPNSTAPYTFTVVDRQGNDLAIHPQSYNTECERDLAIDTLIYGSQNIDARHRIEEQAGGFRYVLLNPEDKVLMTGLQAFATAQTAEAGWQSFLSRATHRDNYIVTEESGAEYPFGFDLLHTDGQVIATSAIKYATKAEAKMAFLAILNYICHTEWSTVITGEPGIYWFNLIGENERLLLTSAATYPDEPSAKLAWQSVLPVAGDKNRYYNLPGFGFDLRDVDGKVIATHPQQYSSHEEREAAQNLIINYVRTDVPVTKTPNTGGAFYAVIHGADGTPAFIGTAIHPNYETAEADLAKLLQLSADPDRYLPHAAGHLGCNYGFYLTDETGRVVAKHPRPYPDLDARNKAMLAVFAWLTHGAALTDHVVAGIQDYRFALINKAGAQVLVSSQSFQTASKALFAFGAMLTHAGNNARYKRFNHPDGKPGFYLEDDRQVPLAEHSTRYGTPEARESAILDIVLLAALHGANYRLFEEDGKWKFALQNTEGKDILIDTGGASDKAGAAENLKQAFVWAQQKDRYVELDDHTDCLFGFSLRDPDHTVIAIHPESYPSDNLRDAALCAFIDHLAGLSLTPEIFGIQASFYLELSDFAGKVLLVSKKDYPTAEAAKTAWMSIVQAIVEPANFQVTYDNTHCQYTAGILVDGQIIAGPQAAFPNRSQANAWIDTLRLLLLQQPVKTEIPGTTCGWYFVVDHTEAGPGARLTGTRRYPTPADARRACLDLSVLLASPQTFKVEETDGLWYLVVYDQPGLLVARSEVPFDTQDSALAVYDQIISKPGQPATDICKPVKREHEYRCSLWNGDKIVLEHTSGKPFIRLGRPDCDWPSRAVRDAMMKATLRYFLDLDADQSGVTLEFPPAAGGQVYYALKLPGLGFTLTSDKTFATETDAKTEFDSLFKKWRAKENYRPLDDETTCRHGFEVIEADIRELACQDCNHLLEWAQVPERYNYIYNEEACLYGFELTDSEGIPCASNPNFYSTRAACDAALAAVVQQVNGEGMHLVEHLLLRPRKKAVEPAYIVEIDGGSPPVPLLRLTGSFTTPAEAGQAFWNMMEAIVRAQDPLLEGLIKIAGPVPGESCRFVEILENLPTGGGTNTKVLARSPQGYCVDDGDDDATRARNDVRNLANALPGTVIDKNAPLPPFARLVPVPRLYDELESDKMLPVVADCSTPVQFLSPGLSDPYSFRATVVLPYWPARFRKSEFRSFLETTLRREAPAHVFLRICWVDPCQMREFEDAFRRWLNTKAAGELSCDTSASLNALIDVLSRLRNIYPAATLHDCSEPGPGSNQVVLNYSVIGSEIP